MNKKFRKLILPVSILAATQSYGLGLGGLQVDSNLDETLKGKIPLILSEDEISDNIKVSLANAKDYQKVGLDKSYVPSNIKVELVDNEGEKFIKIYSKGPVSEPIVSLLLVVDWANGHLLREFTLLLDPPLFNQNLSTDNYAQPVQTQKYEAPAKIEETTAEDDQTVSQVDYSSTISDNTYNGSQQITVQSGDTLWKIANNNRSGYASTQQVMVAIFNNNPSAFQNNDMNLLKKGAVLTLPDSDQINAISNSQAISEVSSQTRQWSQLQSEDEYSQASNSSDVDYGIELVPPNEGDDSGNAQGSSNSTNNTAKLIAELSQVKEKLASSTLESDELSGRVQELEQIIKDQELALSLKDTSLAQLQQQLANESDKVADDVWDDATAATTDETASDDEMATTDEMASTDETASINEMASTDETASTDEMASSDEMMPADEMASSDEMTSDEEMSVTDESASTQEQAPTDEVVIKDVQPPQKVVETTPPPQEASFFDKAMSFKNEILMGLGALLLALVGFFFMKNRNKADADTGNDSFLDEISQSDDSLTDLSLDSIESDLEEEVEGAEELNLEEEDFNLDEDLNDDNTELNLSNLDEVEAANDDNTELNLSTLEDEVEMAVENLDIDGEPDVIVMDDDIDLDLDLEDLEVEDLSELEDIEESQEEITLDDDSDDLDIDLDLDEDLSLDLDDSIDEEQDIDAQEVEIVEENLEEEELDFGDDLDLTLDDIDFDDVDLESTDDSSDSDTTEESLELSDEDLDLSVDDSIQMAIDDLEEETAENLELDSPEELETTDEDFDLGLDLDDVVDDAIDTKLDLARAYFEMGDVDGAKQMVEEVLEEGTEEQQSKAQELKSEIESS